jgi:hypothetical protein
VTNEISEVTRREIADFFGNSDISLISWSGRFTDRDFLARLYDLTRLPSRDNRFGTAAADIWQHRVNNYDWDDNWVFYDDRFNLLYVPDEEFLRFLCETVHPVVRRDTAEAIELANIYNEALRADGWEIIEIRRISGRPVFAPRRFGERFAAFAEPTGWQKVDRQTQEVRSRLDEATTEEQYQAVGLLCREVLISVSQEVYDPAQHSSGDGVVVNETDAKRMLEAIFESDLKGSANSEARAHAKAAMNLALALQHKRTANFTMAALCSEATLSVVNLLAILAGRRGRSLG